MPKKEPTILRQENGQYKNAERFIILQAQNRLLPGQLIRVYNSSTGAGNGPQYVVGPDNNLYAPDQEDQVNPREVLSKRGAPNGWSFDGKDHTLLPESQFNRMLDMREARDPAPPPANRTAEIKKRLGIKEAID